MQFEVERATTINVTVKDEDAYDEEMITNGSIVLQDALDSNNSFTGQWPLQQGQLQLSILYEEEENYEDDEFEEPTTK